MSPYDAILIDFYGTIAAGDRQAVESACTGIVEACEIPMTPADFAIHWGERFFATIGRSNHADFRTLYQCEVLSLQETLRSFDCDGNGDAAAFVQELEQYWRNPPLYDDALDFLRRCRLPTICVSNADTEAIHAAIDRHNLRFDAVVTSEIARCYKPEPKIFHDALATSGLTPDRVFHVGDSLHSDMGGAAAAGITGVWICRENRIHDIGALHAPHKVAKLTELHDRFPPLR